MILVKKSLEIQTIDIEEGICGRYVLYKCKIQGQLFLLINIYAPTSNETENSTFLANLYEKIQNFIGDDHVQIVSGGDWNFTENNTTDRRGGRPRLWNLSISEISKYKENLDIIDIWRQKYPDQKRFTWRSGNKKLASRIDRWYISDSLQPAVNNVSIIPGIASDHSVLLLHLKCKSFPTGPGMWKLNTSLLNDINFVDAINQTIDEVGT